MQDLIAAADATEARTLSSSAQSRAFPLLARTGLWLAIAIAEMLAISWLFDLQLGVPLYLSPFFYMRQAVIWALISGAAFVLVIWPRRMDVLAAWQDEQRRHPMAGPIALNALLFALLVGATVLVMHAAGQAAGVPWGWLGLYTGLLFATGLSVARLDVPFGGQWRLIRRYLGEVVLSLMVGLAIVLFSMVTAAGWDVLAGATLKVVLAILSLYESSVSVDLVERSVTIGLFKAIITANCSGSEGIALVFGFVSIYLWVFRDTLRFPQALLLYPIGIAGIWLLNAVRIALLTSLGAHVSPHMAVQGFHSQAGWIAYLVATFALMVLAQKVAYFHPKPVGTTVGTTVWAAPAGRGPDAPLVADKADDRVMLAYLAPFMGLMVGAIVMAATVPHERPLYPIKVAAVLLGLWLFRDVWRGVRWSVPWEGVAVGFVVGALWIVTDPDPAAGAPLAAWLEAIGPGAAAAWIALRVFGSSVTVPLAEELAFRGFLYRWIVRRNFVAVSYAHVSWLAVVVSSALFGAMHDRWLAGALAGVAFALVMVRTNSLSGAVVAHMVANLLICLWALVFAQWSLL